MNTWLQAKTPLQESQKSMLVDSGIPIIVSRLSYSKIIVLYPRRGIDLDSEYRYGSSTRFRCLVYRSKNLVRKFILG